MATHFEACFTFSNLALVGGSAFLFGMFCGWKVRDTPSGGSGS